MDTAVRFYTEVLGLKLMERYENHWATVDAGPGLTIGLHPVTPATPAPPGTPGAVQIGLEIDEPIERVVELLRQRGAKITSEIVTFEAGKCVSLEDPDGNGMYLWEQPAENEDEPEVTTTGAAKR